MPRIPDVVPDPVPDATPGGASLPVPEPEVLRELCGELGTNLRLARDILGVEVQVRGDRLAFSGPEDAVRTACGAFGDLASLVRQGRALHPGEVRDALRAVRARPGADLAGWLRDTVVHDRKQRPITARTPNQHRYVEALRAHAIVFGHGPAGTGKTFLAVAAAVAALRRGEVQRIILSRPAVEAGEKLGFLPGDLTQKVDPYLRPLLDALSELVEPAELERLLARQVVEIAPLAFMRGRTLSDAFVVLDEAQNTTVEQLKMFLTRLGHGGRMVVTGDPSQCDLPARQPSGLAHALRVLADVEGVAICGFDASDIVRHPLVAAIVAVWDRDRDGADGRADPPMG